MPRGGGGSPLERGGGRNAIASGGILATLLRVFYTVPIPYLLADISGGDDVVNRGTSFLQALA